MFHRKDAFVPADQFKFVEGRVHLDDKADSSARATCKRLGVDWNQCVFWLGLPMMLEDGQVVGRVGNVLFEQETGKVVQVESDGGATANLLLGTRAVPVDLIKGFRTGIGEVLSTRGEAEEDDEKAVRGALVVDGRALELELEDGLAEKAGTASAVVADKAKTAAASASEKASVVAKKAGEAVNQGAYSAGKQISKTKGMFSAFKEEYDKARNAGDEDE